MKTLPFVKMHGLGNDYVYIDGFQPDTADLLRSVDLPVLARRMSDRHFGVGSDGLVLMLPSEEADARMRIFNADGSEAEMCGNAIRCVGKYLYESGLCRRLQMLVETRAGIRVLLLQATKGVVRQVQVNMGQPKIISDTLRKDNKPIGFTSVNIGNPHAVFFRNDVQQIEEVSQYGPYVSAHSHFPEGTNVEFVFVRNTRELDVRVWERGSGVTMACGTGACAAAVAAIWLDWTENEVTVHLQGGDLLVRRDEEGIVYLVGTATEVFRGEYLLED